jgi:hypothetical protein
VHLVTDRHAPAIPGAYELSAAKAGASPTLPQAMRVISAAGVVITNVWWALDLAVGYGRPVEFLLPGLLAWADPYRDCPGVRPPVRVHRGGCLSAADGGCGRGGCRTRLCANAFEAPGLLEGLT